jgi:hypothetical protein
MKIKHNKKRNTAFIYESLIREATVAIIKKDDTKKQKVVNVIKEYFSVGSVLKKDLDCYQSLYTHQNLNKETSERILLETKMQRRMINPQQIFDEQTKLINVVNKEISPSVFSNFVPNYKTLATIAQMFSDKVDPKNKVLLENKIVSNMCLANEESSFDEQIDKTVYSVFANKFNEKYNSTLLESQKNLLNYYVNSFTDNSLSLKVFLNEEITNLKNKLAEAKSLSEIKEDAEMVNKTDAVIEKLNSFSGTEINDEVLLTVLKTQNLVEEIFTDGDNS